MTEQEKNQKRELFLKTILLVAGCFVGLFLLFNIYRNYQAKRIFRDEQRLRDVQDLRERIELFYEIFGHYPQSAAEEPFIDQSTSADSDNLWIKGFHNRNFMSAQGLPVDPLNNSKYYYQYKSDKPPADEYEINIVFETKKYRQMMQDDGGNDSQKYETGTDLELI